MTDKDKYLIEELEKRLCWYRDEATDKEFDAEQVDAICVMLQKLSPIKGPRMSREEAYRNIMERVQEEDNVEETDGFGEAEDAEKTGRLKRENRKDKEFEKEGEKRKKYFSGRRGLRAAVLFIAVFGAALLSLNMVTYAREDKSLFTMILERVGVIEIVKEKAVDEMAIIGDEEIKTFYDSWSDLDSDMKSKIFVPEYIPNDYELYGIRYLNYNNRKLIRANYYNKKNGHILFEITLWKENSDQYREMTMEEEGYTLLSEYSNENMLFYQYEDEYVCTVFMEDSFYRISGNISLQEMVKIKESLGENK